MNTIRCRAQQALVTLTISIVPLLGCRANDEADGFSIADAGAVADSSAIEVGGGGAFAEPTTSLSPQIGGTAEDDALAFQPGTLTAGMFDDNLNLDAARRLLEDWAQADIAGEWPIPNLLNHRVIRLLDADGNPLSGADIVVRMPTDADSQTLGPELFAARTTADGRVVLASPATTIPSGPLELEVLADGAPETVTIALEPGVVDVVLPDAAAAPADSFDLAIILDTTASMGDELAYLQAEIDSIVAAVKDAHPNVSQRFALVAYRDQGDVYVTRTLDFTYDFDLFAAALADLNADGGGDYPEAVAEALEAGLNLPWAGGSGARVCFWLADAPPRPESAAAAMTAIEGLRRKGVGIYPCGASGVDINAEGLMRWAALVTGRRYCFLTDDSGVGNAHDEPRIPCYQVERLDRLMARIITGELTGELAPADPANVIRTVGNPVDGVCQP